MNGILKNIRKYLNMNQTELAKRLGVTFDSVNRWENGRGIPGNPMQTKYFRICQEENVPLYQMVLDKIEGIAAEIKVEEGHVLLYHGSKNGIEGEIGLQSRTQCDFGKGFYMGAEPGQCLLSVCGFPRSRFYILSVDLQNLECFHVPDGIDWAMLIAYNRQKMEKIKWTQLYDTYQKMTGGCDLAIGPIADDRMFYVFDGFFQGTVTDAALLKSMSALKLGKQYAMLSQKGCAHTHITAEVPLSYLERLGIQAFACENRETGVSLAADICRKYRREGRFFDELLEDSGGYLWN